MGQYYCGAILGKTTHRAKKIIIRKSFSPYMHENGAKLMEHSYVGNWYVKAYEYALANEFYGFPFVWAGDYADNVYDTCVYGAAHKHLDKKADKQARIAGYHKCKDYVGYGKDYYKKVNGDKVYVSYKEFSEVAPKNKVLHKCYNYAINFTKKEYCAIPKRHRTMLVIHPLPLLCALGNGRGGGDYHGTDMNMVGRWACDCIGIGNEIPTGFTEITPNFSEI